MSDEDVARTRLRIGGWLPSYDAEGQGAGSEPVSEPASDGAAEAVAAEPVVEAVWTRAGASSSRRRAVLVGLTVVLALAGVGFGAVLPGAGSGGTPAPSLEVAPTNYPQWPVGPITDGPSPSAAVSVAASPRTAGPAPGGRPGAPGRTAGGGTGVTPAVPSPTGTVVSLTIGSRVGLEPVSRPGYRVRHRNFVGRIDPIGPGSSSLDRADSTFTVRAGLAGSGCVSFESINFPGYYLRHQNFEIYLHRRDGNQVFDADATFCAVQVKSEISLRSYNYPSRYLYHHDSRLHVGSSTTTAAMTFAVRGGL